MLWGEFLVFHSAFLACRWPSEPATATYHHTAHVALIADPQLTDRYSYSFTSNGGPLAEAIQFYSDLYMRRSFHLLQRLLAPSHVFVLGDLLDSTKWLRAAEYEAEVDRYRRVFNLVDPNTLMYSISGNHDVGFRIANAAALAERYEHAFGPINNRVQVGQFEFVLLSSASLEAEAWDQRSYDRTAAFLQDLRSAGASPFHPRVLLTHVPLWRPQSASCGPLRENSPQIPDSQGFSYKCLIGEELSRGILDAVRPVYVFSGDDHDQCVVLHSSTRPTASFFEAGGGHAGSEWNTTFYAAGAEGGPDGSVVRVTHAVERGVYDDGARPPAIAVETRWAGGEPHRGHLSGGKTVGIPEQTVGTFSFLQGNRRPSFALLSLHSGRCAGEGKCSSHRLAVDVCFLPQQLLIYAWYGALALASLVALCGYHGYQGCCATVCAAGGGLLPGPALRPSSSGGVRAGPGSWWRRLALELVALLLACLSFHLFLVVFSTRW